jgi:glycosyltransferase involved in cell wall biosynthesis
VIARQGNLRIAILTHYYAPEVGAPQTRLGETARLLAGFGHEVRVITGPPHYPDGHVRPGYSAAEVRHERIDGIEVLRLPVLVRPNRGFLDRVVDQGSFSFAAVASAATIRWSDAFLVDSPPLFLGLTARVLAAVTRRPYVFHVADPWPDFPIAMGAIRGRLPIAAARWLETQAYRGAAVVTTVSDALVRRLDANPAAQGRVRLLPNGVDVRRFREGDDGRAARAALGWPEARLSLAYVGTIGLAQGVGTLLAAMVRLRDDDVVLHVYGDGVERAELEERARTDGLVNVRFHGSVPASQVPRILAAVDASVVLLRRGPLYDESVPTKLVEGLAAGRPVIVSAAGESARIVRDAAAGFVAEPEDVDGLVGAIRSCLESLNRAAIGAAGRDVAEKTFDRVAIARRLEGYLAEAVADEGSGRA